MNSTLETSMVWHNDGHRLWLRIDKADLKVLLVECPEAGECHSKQGCVVQWFINLYGFDCNIGSAAPEEHLEICWALVGEPDHLDIAQLWFVPVNDEVFYAWMQTRT